MILAENPHATVDIMAGDVTSSASMRAFVDACMQRHGRVDVLVNNVGAAVLKGVADTSEEDWDSQIAVNAKSVYLTSHLILPIMEKQEGGGVVVNISSIAAMRYLGDATTAYATAKGGDRGVHKGGCCEVCGEGGAGECGGADGYAVGQGMGADYEVVRKQRNERSPTGGWDGVGHCECCSVLGQ